jgi:DNA-binding Lrp family transcriptional regulator
MDTVDRQILSLLNKSLPLVDRPYRQVADALGITEAEAVDRIRAMKSSGLIRRIGAVLDPRSLGWTSVLCAADIAPSSVEEYAAVVGAYEEVTHNYLRSGHPNCWFTVIAPDGDRLGEIVAQIEERLGVPILSLPARKVFKIRVSFDMD